MPDPETSSPIGRLKRRADFLRAAKGRRWHTSGLTLQVSAAHPTRDAPRIGFTLTRKVGCAVVRNRVRRRLKAAACLLPDLTLEAGRDYVVIGRVEALRLPFDRLKHDLADAAFRLKAGSRRDSRPRRHTTTRPERTRPEL